MNDNDPAPRRRKFRTIVVWITLCGLAIDYVGFSFINIVSAIGGPLALAAILTYTILTGLTLWFLPADRQWFPEPIVTALLLAWPFASFGLVIVADPIQERLWVEDTERVARSYGKGELPPGCYVDSPYRANFYTPIKCDGKVDEIADWYRARLGRGWNETSEKRRVTFSRTANSGEKQEVLIIRTLELSTEVIVSPTQTNR